MPFDDQPDDIGQHIRQLIRQVQQGDEKARERLHELHWQQIYRWAEQRLGSRRLGGNSASDFVQETLMKADRKLHEFRGDSAAEFKAWLRRISDNTINQADRHARTKKQGEDKTEPLEEDVLPALQRSPSSQVAGREEWAVVVRALDQLPDRQRTAVLLRHVEGYALAEIAERLDGCSEVAAASQISRGLAALREILGHGPLDPAGPDGKAPAPLALMEQAIAEYLRRTDLGHKVDLDAFVAGHPECGGALRARLEWIEQVQELLKDR